MNNYLITLKLDPVTIREWEQKNGDNIPEYEQL